MSKVTVCDVCQTPKKCPFVVTEKDGRVFDVCSPACLKAHVEAQS